MEESSDVLKTAIVGELQSFFDQKFSDLKRDLKSEVEWTTESARKKVRLNSSISFSSAGNKKQFDFNCEILDLLDTCDRAVSQRDASKAKQLLKETSEKIEHRNKIIRIADSSSAGWGTVHEYELCDFASDSDDDKRIRKAEERAINKIEKRKKALSTDSFSSSFRSSKGSSVPSSRSSMGRRFVQLGEVVCYKCGEVGHFASGCATDYGAKMSRFGYGRGRGAVGPVATASYNQFSQQQQQQQQQQNFNANSNVQQQPAAIGK